MAESLAAVGLASAIVQFVDFTARVIERLNEFHSRAKDAPQPFSDLKIRLPLLRQTLDNMHFQAEAKLVDPKAQEALLDVVSGCQAQVRVLDDILSRMLPPQGSGRVRRVMKALSSVIQEKTLVRVMDRIQEYQLSLMHYQTTFITNFEGVNSPSPAYLSQHSGSEASQQSPRDLNRMVHVHIDGGEFFAGRDLYLPASTCLTDLRRQLSNNKEFQLLDEHRQALRLQHLSNVIIITEQESIYGKGLMNKNEPFVVFLGKAFPPPEVTICPRKESTEGEGSSIHVDDNLEISFHRTARLPNDGKTYALPAGLGKLPMFDSQDFSQRLPVDMREKGGLILPMWQREALWIRFLCERGNNMAYAIRPFVGGVNAISGKVARPNMSTMLRSLNRVDRAQDYIVVQRADQSRAQWLDGIAVAPGVVRQFVALPIGSRESIEWQMTGVNDVGGMQLEIIPQYPISQVRITRFDVKPWNRDIGPIAVSEGDLLTTPADLGINAGIPVYMRTNSPRPRTLLDELARSGNLKSNRLSLCVDKARTITIKVIDNAYERFYRLHGSTCLLPVMQDFCTTRDKDPNTVTFLCNHMRIRDHDTADDLDMEDGDCVEVLQYQVGGGWSDPRWNISHLEAPGQGFGAGAQIFQNINPDKQDPRSWNTDAAKLLNIQVLNLEVFERIMGVPPPSTPISLATYRQAGIPFPQGYRETNSSIRGNFNRVVALDDLDKMDRGSPSEEILNYLHAGRCRGCGRTVNFEKLCPRCYNDHEFLSTPLALQPVEAEWERFESVVDLASLTPKGTSAPKAPSEAVCLPTSE